MWKWNLGYSKECDGEGNYEGEGNDRKMAIDLKVKTL
jgi:hypothetical protein